MDVTNFILSHRERALLIGDYGTYRSQLSQQLFSLRRRLGISTPKNAKYTAKPITVEDLKSNHEFGRILILTAERAWAHAMYMKSSHAEDSASQKFPGSTRSHIVSRLSKASKQAETLLALISDASKDTQSTIDLLEVQAYAAYLVGSAEFEKHSASPKQSDLEAQRQVWKKCLENMSIARVIYAALLKKTKKDCFKEILNTSVDPTIRFAAYQSQIPRTTAVSEVARQQFPQDKTALVKAINNVDDTILDEDQAKTDAGGAPTTISWRGRKANIVDAAIGQALVAVSTAETQLKRTLQSAQAESYSNSQATAYDEVLNASQDAVDATRHAIDEHEKERIAESDSRMQDLRVTNLAVNYDLIGWRIGRNRVLIGSQDGLEFDFIRGKQHGQTKTISIGKGQKLARLRERVVLYDAILQSIDSVKDIQGAVRDSTFVDELEAKRAYYQALKCVNIAHSHTFNSNNKNALALLLRAQTLLEKANQTLSSANQSSAKEPLKLDIHKDVLEEALETIEMRVYQYQGLVELQRLDEKPKAERVQSVPVTNNLNEYSPKSIDLANIINYPPKLQPVPVKPLFLDLAWNYIDYPGRTPAVEHNAPATNTEGKQPAKRGWFGFGR